MKRALNLLKLFCTLLVMSVSFKFLERLYMIIHYYIYKGSRSKIFNFHFTENWSEGTYYLSSIMVLILSAYLIYLAIEFRKVFLNFTKEEIFTKENSIRLRKIGKGLIIYAIIIVLSELLLGLSNANLSSNQTSYNSGYAIGHVIGIIINKRLPIVLVALFVQFISFIIIRGNVIKVENDLTI